MKKYYYNEEGQLVEKMSWNTKRLIFIYFPALILITIASIYIVYGKSYFHKWSWLQSSIIISLFTCIWPYVVRRRWGRFPTEAPGLGALMYVLFIKPFEFQLIYPGLKRLGMASDSKAILLIVVIGVIHGIGFYAVLKGRKNIPE